MVWAGFVCINVVTLYKQPISTIAAEVTRLKNHYNVPTSNIVADEDGVGGGVVDLLKCEGFVNNSSPIEIDGVKQNYTNLKSQCYFMLSEKINKGKIYIKSGDIEVKNLLIQELEQIKRKDIDKDGKLSVLPKDQVKALIGRSPDYSDAMMMRMYFELRPETKALTQEQINSILRDFR